MRKQSNQKRGWIVAFLAVVVVLGALGMGREICLESARQDFIALLEQNAGSYNEDRVVLSSTTRQEAETMAAEFGGTLRITEDGSFAVINLPDGMTLTDIAENDDYRKYHDRILLDYNNFGTTEDDDDTADDTELRSGYQVADPMYLQQTYIDYLNIGRTTGARD